jgi:DNA-binding MarR family transcriptional regulator
MERFCKIKELYRLIYEIESTVQTKFKLSVNECLVLCSINKGKSTAGEISSTLSQSKSRMSKILNEMVQKNLIIREHDVTDKRKTHFRMTPQGIRKYEKIEKIEIDIPDIQINCI